MRTLRLVQFDILRHAAAAPMTVMRAHTAVVACRQPGTVDTNREGVGGGFRELDEEEAAEARRRREQFENDDTGMCAHPVCCFLWCGSSCIVRLACRAAVPTTAARLPLVQPALPCMLHTTLQGVQSACDAPP